MPAEVPSAAPVSPPLAAAPAPGPNATQPVSPPPGGTSNVSSLNIGSVPPPPPPAVCSAGCACFTKPACLGWLNLHRPPRMLSTSSRVCRRCMIPVLQPSPDACRNRGVVLRMHACTHEGHSSGREPAAQQQVWCCRQPLLKPSRPSRRHSQLSLALRSPYWQLVCPMTHAGMQTGLSGDAMSLIMPDLAERLCLIQGCQLGQPCACSSHRCCQQTQHLAPASSADCGHVQLWLWLDSATGSCSSAASRALG